MFFSVQGRILSWRLLTAPWEECAPASVCPRRTSAEYTASSKRTPPGWALVLSQQSRTMWVKTHLKKDVFSNVLMMLITDKCYQAEKTSMLWLKDQIHHTGFSGSSLWNSQHTPLGWSRYVMLLSGYTTTAKHVLRWQLRKCLRCWTNIQGNMWIESEWPFLVIYDILNWWEDIFSIWVSWICCCGLWVSYRFRFLLILK